MEGRIVEYFQHKSNGIINDEEGNRYVFNSSQVETIQPIEVGQFIHFTPYTVEEELSAKNVRINVKKNNLFFEVGKTRIMLSNIKSYEIIIEEARRVWKEEKKANLLIRILLWIVSPGDSALPKEIKKSKIVSYDVLKIRTFQGDDYKFSEREYDINVNEKVKELNDYLNLKLG
jgi:hypothetical protein